MTKLSLSFACADYDRTQALVDGSVKAEGIDLNVLKMAPDEIFYRMMRHEEFDMSELSASSYLIAKDQGLPKFTALPVFLSRTFRHSSIYVHRDGGIANPEQLRGKRIGVPEYHVTALVWVRGMLQHQYGIHPSEMEWFWGGVDAPRQKAERVSIELPAEIRLSAIGNEQSLNQMLLDRKIDAIISPRAPIGFLKGAGEIARLFEDYKAEEMNYYRETGIFPIMHVVAVKDDLLEKHPWIAMNLYQAFMQAKQKAYQNLSQIGSLRVTLPWLAAEVEQTRRIMGEDFWSYGIGKNRVVMETLIRYAHEQGIISRSMALDEIFAGPTLQS